MSAAVPSKPAGLPQNNRPQRIHKQQAHPSALSPSSDGSRFFRSTRSNSDAGSENSYIYPQESPRRFVQNSPRDHRASSVARFSSLGNSSFQSMESSTECYSPNDELSSQGGSRVVGFKDFNLQSPGHPGKPRARLPSSGDRGERERGRSMTFGADENKNAFEGNGPLHYHRSESADPYSSADGLHPAMFKRSELGYVPEPLFRTGRANSASSIDEVEDPSRSRRTAKTAHRRTVSSNVTAAMHPHESWQVGSNGSGGSYEGSPPALPNFGRFNSDVLPKVHPEEFRPLGSRFRVPRRNSSVSEGPGFSGERTGDDSRWCYQGVSGMENVYPSQPPRLKTAGRAQSSGDVMGAAYEGDFTLFDEDPRGLRGPKASSGNGDTVVANGNNGHSRPAHTTLFRRPSADGRPPSSLVGRDDIGPKPSDDCSNFPLWDRMRERKNSILQGGGPRSPRRVQGDEEDSFTAVFKPRLSPGQGAAQWSTFSSQPSRPPNSSSEGIENSSSSRDSESSLDATSPRERLPRPTRARQQGMTRVISAASAAANGGHAQNPQQASAFGSGKGGIKWSCGRKIGMGTYGEVFMALNTDNGEQFAVKRIRVKHSLKGNDPSANPSKSFEEEQKKAAQLRTEINIMKGLKHENIVAYVGSHFQPNAEFVDIFLEYVTGGSLAQLIHEHGPLELSLIAKFTKHITLGVQFLHSKQIIHRDIKGANVLLTKEGVAKLADFGCSKQLVQLHSTDQEKEDTFRNIRGSIPWMAPEMIQQVGHSFPVDIWSLGCTVIEMTTGKAPWPALKEQLHALFVIAKTETPPPMPEDYPGKGGPLDDFLQSACEVAPANRATADELIRHPFVNLALQYL